MGRSTPRKFHRRKNHQPFLEKGLNALILGAGLWLIPLFMSGQPLLNTKSNALQMLAWFLMGLGLLLLGIHYVLKDKAGDGERGRAQVLSSAPINARQASGPTRGNSYLAYGGTRNAASEYNRPY